MNNDYIAIYRKWVYKFLLSISLRLVRKVSVEEIFTFYYLFAHLMKFMIIYNIVIILKDAAKHVYE